MQAGGQSSLALRFTRAEIKGGGKAVPIEATIVGIAPPENSYGVYQSASDSPPEPWDGSALQIDVVGALSGVDLHSRIAGENSGVFVSTKDDMKLAAQSRISLAIGVKNAG
jgi:hypothetical protein